MSAPDISASEAPGRPKRLRRFHGPLLTLGVIVLVGHVLPAPLEVLNFVPILLTGVMYSAYSGGLAAGLLSAAFTCLYYALLLFPPGLPAPYTYQEFLRLLVVFLAAPLMAVLTSILKQRTEKVIQQRVMLEKAAAAEATLRKAYDELESRVQERTAELAGANRALREEIAERKEAEAALKEVSENLWRVTESIPDFLWSAEIDRAGQFRHRFYSPVVARVTGRPPEFFMQGADRWLSIVHPQDTDRVTQAIDRLSRRQSTQEENEYRILLPDGTERWVHDRSNVTVLEDGTIRLDGVVSDISERRRVETALVVSEAKFRGLLEAAPDGIMLLDAAGRIVLVNEQSEAMSGYSREEILGQEVRLLLPERFWPVFDRLRANEYKPRSGGTADGTLIAYARRKDGSEFPIEISMRSIEASGGLMGMAVIRDVTERRRAEEEHTRLILERAARKEAEAAKLRMAFLAELSEALGASLDHKQTLKRLTQLLVPRLADYCVVYAPGEDGQLSQIAHAHVDPTMEGALDELCRYFPVKNGVGIPTTSVLETRTALIVPAITDELLKSFAADSRPQKLWRKLRAESGILVPLVSRDRYLGVIAFMSSVSQRRYGPEDLALAEEVARRAALALENARLYREAQDAVHLREHFLSVASHELRTPLTVMQGFLEGLMRIVECAAEAGDAPGVTLDRVRLTGMLQKMDRSSRRLAGLIDELLDATRIQRGRLTISPEPMDLTELLVSVLEGIRTRPEIGQGKGRVELAVNLPNATQVCGVWDRSRLEQVLVNLIDNAIKYSLAGGTIWVELSVEGAEGGAQNGRQVHLIVRDRGIGIPAGELERVFIPFYRASNTTEKSLQGLGLGLTITKDIVDRHGGRIWVESGGNETGSAFHVVLPASDVTLGPGYPA